MKLDILLLEDIREWKMDDVQDYIKILERNESQNGALYHFMFLMKI